MYLFSLSRPFPIFQNRGEFAAPGRAVEKLWIEALTGEEQPVESFWRGKKKGCKSPYGSNLHPVYLVLYGFWPVTRRFSTATLARRLAKQL